MLTREEETANDLLGSAAEDAQKAAAIALTNELLAVKFLLILPIPDNDNFYLLGR